MAKADEELQAAEAMVIAKDRTIAKIREELKGAKIGENKLGMTGLGAVAVATAGGVGLIQGRWHDPTPGAKNDYDTAVPGVALVLGAGVAVAAGPTNPMTRAAGAGVAIGAACAFAHDIAYDEGVKMRLAADKARSDALKKANGGALPPTQPTPTTAK